MRRLAALLLLTAGCAPTPSEEMQMVPTDPPCGLSLVRDSRFRPGRVPVDSGDSLRACRLPTAADIESACEAEEAVPIPGSQSRDDPDQPQHAFPAYTVSNVQCRFTEEGQSRARCTFDLAAGGEAPRQMDSELVHRFRDLSNDVAHHYWLAHWEVDAICRPATS